MSKLKVLEVAEDMGREEGAKITLLYTRGLSSSEIAEKLKINIETVDRVIEDSILSIDF